ncbi:NAD(P)-binding domain-containing protein, partial [Xanthomonas translucens]
MSSTAPDLRTADIAFVGGGNMARSLIAGLVRQGADPRRIRVA